MCGVGGDGQSARWGELFSHHQPHCTPSPWFWAKGAASKAPGSRLCLTLAVLPCVSHSPFLGLSLPRCKVNGLP